MTSTPGGVPGGAGALLIRNHLLAACMLERQQRTAYPLDMTDPKTRLTNCTGLQVSCSAAAWTDQGAARLRQHPGGQHCKDTMGLLSTVAAVGGTAKGVHSMDAGGG
jgi:hypothetical protein